MVPEASEPADLAAVLKQINEQLNRIEAGQRQQRALFNDLLMALGRSLKEIKDAIDDRPSEL
jgi:hypothetical protein